MAQRECAHTVTASILLHLNAHTHLQFGSLLAGSSHTHAASMVQCPSSTMRCAASSTLRSAASARWVRPASGSHQIPAADDEARLHWRVRGRRRSPRRQDRRRSDRARQQVQRHLAALDVGSSSSSSGSSTHRQFGHIILTTSAGIMDHEEREAGATGGKVLGSSIRRAARINIYRSVRARDGAGGGGLRRVIVGSVPCLCVYRVLF